jgi:hypothetical protein
MGSVTRSFPIDPAPRCFKLQVSKAGWGRTGEQP